MEPLLAEEYCITKVKDDIENHFVKIVLDTLLLKLSKSSSHQLAALQPEIIEYIANQIDINHLERNDFYKNCVDLKTENENLNKKLKICEL